MHYGTLLVRAVTSRAQIPVEGATIAVTQRQEEGKPKLLALSITGPSGRISPIKLPTPPPRDSQEPGEPDGFTLCDVWAEHPDYQLLLVEGVQVFPGVESIQTMALLPLAEEATVQEGMSVIDVTPQPL